MPFFSFSVEFLPPIDNHSHSYYPKCVVLISGVFAITEIRLPIVQGWSSFSPFTAVDFVSLYIEIPVMILMYIAWMLIGRPDPNIPAPASSLSSASPGWRRELWKSDLVDVNTVDLTRDEYTEDHVDSVGDDKRDKRYQGKTRWLWRVYYWVV